MDQFRRGDLTFDVIDAGPADGPVVVLLHGFPQFNTSWNVVIERLNGRGYRCLAPNQRGYSPGARPPRRRDYRSRELIEDVGALIDASGAERVHLVGHDWGAAVAWGVAAEMPDRLATVSPLSVPHPAAFVNSFITSRQGLASWYMYVFQLPWVPERFLLGKARTAERLANSLESAGLDPEAARRDAQAMAEPGVLTAALNWYRAILLSDPRSTRAQISVPTMYVWSDEDVALTEKPARNTARYVDADYRFEVLHGSHWLPDQQPDTVANLLLEWFEAHPI